MRNKEIKKKLGGRGENSKRNAAMRNKEIKLNEGERR